MKYIKLRSLTFWTGAANIVAGALLGVHDANPDLLHWYGDALAAWVGPVGPHILIATGLGFIGLRRAQDGDR